MATQVELDMMITFVNNLLSKNIELEMIQFKNDILTKFFKDTFEEYSINDKINLHAYIDVIFQSYQTASEIRKQISMLRTQRSEFMETKINAMQFVKKHMEIVERSKRSTTNTNAAIMKYITTGALCDSDSEKYSIYVSRTNALATAIIDDTMDKIRKQKACIASTVKSIVEIDKLIMNLKRYDSVSRIEISDDECKSKIITTEVSCSKIAKSDEQYMTIAAIMQASEDMTIIIKLITGTKETVRSLIDDEVSKGSSIVINPFDAKTDIDLTTEFKVMFDKERLSLIRSMNKDGLADTKAQNEILQKSIRSYNKMNKTHKRTFKNEKRVWITIKDSDIQVEIKKYTLVYHRNPYMDLESVMNILKSVVHE